MRGLVYATDAATVGREASTAGVSTIASGATVSGVVSSTDFSLSLVVSVVSTGASALAATFVISADANAGLATWLTSRRIPLVTTITPFLSIEDSIGSTPTLNPVLRPSLASVRASSPLAVFVTLKVAKMPSGD